MPGLMTGLPKARMVEIAGPRFPAVQAAFVCWRSIRRSRIPYMRVVLAGCLRLVSERPGVEEFG